MSKRIILTELIKSARFQKAFVCFFALSFIIPLQFLTQSHLPQELSAVDTSWMLGLSEAWATQKITGKDVVFTYGPLAFLSTRILLDGHILPLLAFDLYFACSFLYIISRTLSYPHSFLFTVALLATCFFYKQALFLTLVFSLQLLILLYLNEYSRKPHWLLLVQSALLTCLIFYIKLNMAFISITVLMLFLGYLYLQKKITLHYIAFTLLFTGLAIVCGSFFLPVDLPLYISTAFPLIDAYNDAAYIYPAAGYESFLCFLIYCIFLCFILQILIQLWTKPFSEKVLQTLFLLLGFVVFKQCIVRGDLEHLKDFFFIFPPFLMAHRYVTGARLKGFIILLMVLWSTSAYITYSFRDYYYPLKKIIAVPAYIYRVYEGYDYYALASERVLPAAIRHTIGQQSADIIPWEISTLVVNNMQYNPRPVIQSYQAYSTALDLINYTKYMSANAPEYVIYQSNSIDRHYHFFDDTHLKRAMLSRYYILDTFILGNEQTLLFKRSNIQPQIDFHPVASGTIAVTDSLQVPVSSYPLMLKYNMEYSIAGKLQRLLVRVPYSEVILTTEDKKRYAFQGATSILEGGIFIDHYVGTTSDARLYFNGNRNALPRIQYIRVKTVDDISWKNEVRYEWYELR